jgi:hypothetical protein
MWYDAALHAMAHWPVATVRFTCQEQCRAEQSREGWLTGSDWHVHSWGSIWLLSECTLHGTSKHFTVGVQMRLKHRKSKQGEPQCVKRGG